MANLFSLSRKPFVVCYCFREPIKTFFLDACQVIAKSRVLHLFPVSQTGRSHIINILLAFFFSVRTVNYEKNSVCNLQYRPKTRLIRGIYLLDDHHLFSLLWLQKHFKKHLKEKTINQSINNKNTVPGLLKLLTSVFARETERVN